MYKYLVILFLAAMAYLYFFTCFFQCLTKDQLITLLSSFSGAAFAFLFVIINDWLLKRDKRKKDHYNSLVLMERYVVSQLSIIDTNQGILKKFESIINKRQILVLTLRSVSIREALAENCKEVSIVNEFLNLLNYYDHINHAQINIVEMYNEMRMLFINKDAKGKKKLEMLVTIAHNMNPQIVALSNHYNKVHQASIINLALLRVLMRKEKGFLYSNKFFRKFLDPKLSLSNKMNDRVNAEIIAVKREISEAKNTHST